MFNRMPKIVGSRDLGRAHFQGKLFVLPLVIPPSSSSFGDMFDRMPKM